MMPWDNKDPLPPQTWLLRVLGLQWVGVSLCSGRRRLPLWGLQPPFLFPSHREDRGPAQSYGSICHRAPRAVSQGRVVLALPGCPGRCSWGRAVGTCWWLHRRGSAGLAITLPAVDVRGPFGGPAAQSAVDCLTLWKLTRVGEVGMDMARATRARIECLSCHRCHLFRMAERTSLLRKQ